MVPFSCGHPSPCASEMGTICQIGVFYRETVHVLVRKGSFSVISHYIFNECRSSTVSYSIAICSAESPKMAFLGPKMLYSAVKTPI